MHQPLLVGQVEVRYRLPPLPGRQVADGRHHLVVQHTGLGAAEIADRARQAPCQNGRHHPQRDNAQQCPNHADAWAGMDRHDCQVAVATRVHNAPR